MDVEARANEAEADAARSRSTARALKEERLVQIAREEGRRLGMKEGIQQGRDLGYQQGRAEGYEEGRESATPLVETVYYDEMDEEMERDRDRDRDRERRRDRRRDEEEQNTDRWERPHEYDLRHERDHEHDKHEPQHDRVMHPPPGTVPSSSSYDPRRTRTRFEGMGVPRSDGTFPRPPSVVIPETPVHSVPPSPQPYHNGTPSPLPAFRDIPPDNWIPDQDADARIRLPPPHEMQRSPVPRTPSPPLPPVPEEREEQTPGPVLPVLPPAFEVQRSRSSGSGRHRRRSSSPSSETSGRTSELDLLAAPRERGYASLGRGFAERERERLSVIREGNSVENTPSVSHGTMRTASTPTVVRQPSMTLKERETPPRFVPMPTPNARGEYYRRPRSPEDERKGNDGRDSRSTVRSSGGISRPPSVPNVTVRPPSAPGTRPPSVSGGRPPSYPSKPPSFPSAPPPFPSGPPSFPSARPPSFPTGTLAEPKPEYRRSQSSSINSEIEIDIQPPVSNSVEILRELITNYMLFYSPAHNRIAAKRMPH